MFEYVETAYNFVIAGFLIITGWGAYEIMAKFIESKGE